MGYKGGGDSNCCWCVWNGYQMLGGKSGGIGNPRKYWNHQDNGKEYLEESGRTEETCCHSVSREKSPVNAGVKNLQRVK